MNIATKKLKTLAKVYNGATPKSDNADFWDGNIPWVTPVDLGDAKYLDSTKRNITETGYRSCNTTLIEANNIIISNRAPIGLVAVNRMPVCTNQGCKALELDKTKIDESYLYYALKASEGKLNSLGTGTTFMEISSDALKNFQIPYVDPEQQKKLSDHLDAKTQTLDKILTAKNHLLDLLEAQKRAAIFNLTTRGIDSGGTLRKVPEEWLGSVPESWQQTYLMGCAYERKKKNYPGNIPTLLSLSYGKLITKDIEDNGGLLPESFDTYQLITAGQIVLRLTDLQNDHKSLRVGYATQDGMITSAYSCVTAKDEVLPKYLYYYLHSADLRKVFYSMGGGVRQSMKFADLKRLVMYIPDKITQQEIVDAIEIKVEQIEKLQEKVKKSINLLEEYRSSLISNVVDGKVEV